MAKSKNPIYQKASFQEVIQLPLLPEEVETVMGYVLDTSHLLEMVEILLLTGYEIAESYDADRERFSICIKGQRADCLNAGKWLYGNGVTLVDAYKSAFWKHFEFFQQKEWTSRSTMSASPVS